MPAPVNKIVCACCGAVQIVELPEKVESENWLPCVLPTGFEWNLPSGKITPVVGEPIYKDAMGADFSHKEYMTKYNIDPEIAYTKMRGKNPKECLPIGSVGRDSTEEEKPKRKVVRLGKY